MTPFQDEIARIIRGFSPKEREIFTAMGGRTGGVAPAPQWFRPGVDKLAPIQTRHPDAANAVKVRLENGGTYGIRDAAQRLDVSESYLRNVINRNDVGGTVRGVKVRRVSPKRRRKAA